jgi:hypothetical protein
MPGQSVVAAEEPGTGVEGVTSSGTEPYRKPHSKHGHGEALEECEVVPPSMPEPQVCGQDDSRYMPTYPEGENPEAGAVKAPHLEDAYEAKDDPECPVSVWFSWLKETAGKQISGKKRHTPKESDLVPTAPAGPATLPDGTNLADPSRPPACEEDPYHNHQHPGCPHMGGCQSGGVCCPLPAMFKERKHIKNKQVKGQPVSMSHGKKKAGKDPESSPVKGVDTMECRPSDTKIDEVDPSKPD